MIRILLSDDNAAFRQTSREQGAALGVEVVAFEDWESSQVALEEYFESFDGVIIDGKGKLRDSSKDEDGKHISAATNWLKEQLGKKGYIPVVIYTGFHAELEPYIFTDAQILRIFDKSKHTFQDVLEFLKIRIADSPIEKLKVKYSDVFSAFGTKYLPESAIKILIELLRDHEAGVYQKTYFNKIRESIEEILQRANQIDKGFFPDELLKDKQTGRPNLVMSTLYWSGVEIDLTKIGGTGSVKAKAPILPKHLGRTYSGLIEITNVLSHRYTEPYSKYANQSALNSLLELICWFKLYVQTNYKTI